MAQTAPGIVIVAEDEASLCLRAALRAVCYWRGQTPVGKLHPGRGSVHFYGSHNLLTGEEIVTLSPWKYLQPELNNAV